MSEEQVKVTADDTMAQAVIAKAEAQVEQLGRHVELAELRVTRSLSAAVSGISALSRIGLKSLKLFGVAIDKTFEALIGSILSYAQNLAMIAAGTAAVNPVYAGLIASAGFVVQLQAIKLQQEGQAEAEQKLREAESLMQDITSSLIIFTRST